jgi:hypothetical protein
MTGFWASYGGSQTARKKPGLKYIAERALYGWFAYCPYGAELEIYCREGGCQGGSDFWNKLQAIFILIIKTDGF